MTNVWFASRGPDSTRGEPFAELPLLQCIEVLGLHDSHWIKPLDETPKFDRDSKNADFTAPEFVVIEVETAEARQRGWRDGFYLLEMRPSEARAKIEAVAGA